METPNNTEKKTRINRREQQRNYMHKTIALGLLDTLLQESNESHVYTIRSKLERIRSEVAKIR